MPWMQRQHCLCHLSRVAICVRLFLVLTRLLVGGGRQYGIPVKHTDQFLLQCLPPCEKHGSFGAVCAVPWLQKGYFGFFEGQARKSNGLEGRTLT